MENKKTPLKKKSLKKVSVSSSCAVNATCCEDKNPKKHFWFCECGKNCPENCPCHCHFGKLIIGLILILLGLLYLGKNLDLLPAAYFFAFKIFWPLIIVVVGFLLLNKRARMASFIGFLIAVLIIGVVGLFFSARSIIKYPNSNDSQYRISRHVEKAVPQATPIADLTIKIDNLISNQLISSPLEITGEAQGPWFFEGSFPVKVLDENGLELGATTAQAQGEWTTMDLVKFKADLTFKKSTSTKGSVVFEKDNPSGLKETERQFVIPVTFK